MGTTRQESLVENYFRKKGFIISRNTLYNSKLIKQNKGEPDFTIKNRKGEKIYVEVKQESSPYFTIEQLNFLRKTIEIGEKYYVVYVSRLGMFIIFEIKKNYLLRVYDKGFFKIKNQSFLFLDNFISLYDFRLDSKINLENI